MAQPDAPKKDRDIERLDLVLVERGLVPTRERAKATILAGSVFVDDKRIDKVGARIKRAAHIAITSPPHPYVSRGGAKLEAAVAAFSATITDKTALDVGASTGGFTDCLLKHGAKKVYALDVGYGQLAWELRNDPRVVVMERNNIRSANREDFDDDIELVTIDVSFISLKKVLPHVKDIASGGANVIALIKPQFEVKKGEVGKGGVVRESETHRRVIDEIGDYATAIGFSLLGEKESPLLGPKGNREFFIHLKN
jgi:23S rRNA (cytidine1920-2'-O)/16S rRNA (cytidine1409-2'-O)-methyltransferase